ACGELDTVGEFPEQRTYAFCPIEFKELTQLKLNSPTVSSCLDRLMIKIKTARYCWRIQFQQVRGRGQGRPTLLWDRSKTRAARIAPGGRGRNSGGISSRPSAGRPHRWGVGDPDRRWHWRAPSRRPRTDA